MDDSGETETKNGRTLNVNEIKNLINENCIVVLILSPRSCSRSKKEEDERGSNDLSFERSFDGRHQIKNKDKSKTSYRFGG